MSTERHDTNTCTRALKKIPYDHEYVCASVNLIEKKQ